MWKITHRGFRMAAFEKMRMSIFQKNRISPAPLDRGNACGVSGKYGKRDAKCLFYHIPFVSSRLILCLEYPECSGCDIM